MVYQPLNTKKLARMHKQYMVEYRKLNLCGFNSDGIQIDQSAAEDVAPISEYKHTTRKCDKYPHEYEVMRDGVKFYFITDKEI